MEILNVNKKAVLKSYRNGNIDWKKELEELFGKEVFSGKVTDRVKTFEDALEETDRPPVPEFLDAPEDLHPYLQAQYKAVIIAEALNEGWKPDRADDEEKKWFPWFYVRPLEFSYGSTTFEYTVLNARCTNRLCFKSEELAKYAGRQFPDVYKSLLLS